MVLRRSLVLKTTWITFCAYVWDMCRTSGAQGCDDRAARAIRATRRHAALAPPQPQHHTFRMRVPVKLAFLCAALSLTATSAFSDEIRLKDGKKLYGVIVAYEDNMFKIKTDFGFVLAEKDKIASIIPTTPAPATPASPPPSNPPHPL